LKNLTLAQTQAYRLVLCPSPFLLSFAFLTLSSTPHPSLNNPLTSSKLHPAVSGYIHQTQIQQATQTAVYSAKVPRGVSASIMGKNVSPIRKLEPQFVAVARAEPMERTGRGKSLEVWKSINEGAVWK